MSGQLAFLACLCGCVALDRRGLWDNHGWSYYEGRAGTAPLYVLGFLILIACQARAALLIRPPAAPRGASVALLAVTLGLSLDVATPDTLGPALYDAHVAASTVLFLIELAVGAWLVGWVLRERPGVVLLAVQVAGGLLAMVSQLQLVGLLGLGILVFQAAFAVLLVLAVRRVGTESAGRVGELVVAGAD